MIVQHARKSCAAPHLHDVRQIEPSSEPLGYSRRGRAKRLTRARRNRPVRVDGPVFAARCRGRIHRRRSVHRLAIRSEPARAGRSQAALRAPARRAGRRTGGCPARPVEGGGSGGSCALGHEPRRDAWIAEARNRHRAPPRLRRGDGDRPRPRRFPGRRARALPGRRRLRRDGADVHPRPFRGGHARATPGEVAQSSRAPRLVRLASARRAGRAALAGGSDPPRRSGALLGCRRRSVEGLRRALSVLVRRDRAYLNWRFADDPFHRYRLFEVCRGADPIGVAVLRVGEWGGVAAGFVVDYLCAPRDAEALFAACLEVLRDAGVAAVYCLHTNPVSTGMLRRLGFLRRGSGLRLLVCGEDGGSHVRDGSGWFVTLGDSNVDRPRPPPES